MAKLLLQKKLSIKYYVTNLGKIYFFAILIAVFLKPVQAIQQGDVNPLLRYYAEFKRRKERLDSARKNIAICSIGGAVGNLVNVDSHVEEYVAKKLNFTVEPIASQVIPRDRYAYFLLQFPLFLQV